GGRLQSIAQIATDQGRVAEADHAGAGIVQAAGVIGGPFTMADGDLAERAVDEGVGNPFLQVAVHGFVIRVDVIGGVGVDTDFHQGTRRPSFHQPLSAADVKACRAVAVVHVIELGARAHAQVAGGVAVFHV